MTTPNEELLARANRLRHELGDSNSRLDRQCVTAMYEMEQALQSQAECIKKLEASVEHWKAARESALFAGAQMKAQLADIAALDVTELVGALQLFAYALPLDKSTVKTCYAVNNQMRDAAHAALSKYKGAK